MKNKLILGLIFTNILIISSISPAFSYIPPTNAYAHVKTDNGTINANDYDSTITMQGVGGITVNGSNNQHKIIISGTNCSAISVSDQTANRNLNTVYKNTSGKTMLVETTVTLNTTGTSLIVTIYVDNIDGNSVINGDITQDINTGINDHFITFVVPNNYFYQINAPQVPQITLSSWFEALNPFCGSGVSSFTGTYNQTLANNVPINSDGFKINFINGTNNPIHIVNSNGGKQVNVTISATGSSGSTLDTMQNIGKGTGNSSGVFVKNTTNTNFQFYNITSTRPDLVTIKHNATDINIGSKYKSDTKTCSSGFYLSAFDNTTGSYSCTSVSFTSGSAFKSDTVSCGAGHFIQSYDNSTGIYTCAADNSGTITTASNLGTSGTGIYSITSGTTLQFLKLISANNNCAFSGNTTNVILTCNTGLTSLNSQTGPAVNIVRGAAGNITVTNSTNQISINTGYNVVVTNGSPQRFTKQVTLPEPEINGIKLSQIKKNTAYTITQNDIIIYVNATAGGNPTIITLPDATTVTNNTYTINKVDFGTNPVMIKPATGQSFSNFLNYNMTRAKDSITFQSNGTAWNILIGSKADYSSNFERGTSINRWVGSPILAYTPSPNNPTSTTITATPWYVGNEIKIDQISLEVSTLVAGSTCRMGIYNDNGTGYPGTLISGSDVGTVSGASTGVKTNTFTKAITLEKGMYWLAHQCSTSTTLLIRGAPLTAMPNIGLPSTMGSAAIADAWLGTFTFGAFPNNFPSSGGTSATTTPVILVRIVG